MSLYRTSTRAMRINLRPCVARANFHASSIRAVKFEGKDMDDLGGPGGQAPRPEAPAGPEAVTRNWVPIAAGVFALGAGVWYMTGSSPKQEKLVSKAKELEQKGSAKADELAKRGAAKADELSKQASAKADELAKTGAAKAKQIEIKGKNLAGGADSPDSVQEMSGRKDTKGGFRAD